MSTLNHLLTFDEYINELWNKGIRRSSTGEERIEDVLGTHSFTDGNGKFHKYGVLPNDFEELVEIIMKIIDRDKDRKNVIDLNMIDVSGLDHLYSFMESIGRKAGRDILKLKFDTSGWILSSCTIFSYFGCDILSDIGVDNWKINPDVVKTITISDFKDGYYETHYPKWYTFNIKDYIKSCVSRPSFAKTLVDKKRTKELGKKCYTVTFNCTSLIRIAYIPDNVTVYFNSNQPQYHRININLYNLTSFKNIKEWNFNGCSTYISINPEIITDDVIYIPEDTNISFPTYCHDISKLPKKTNFSVFISNMDQLGHIEKVNGNFSFMNTRLTAKSLKGMPKTVTKDCDIHNLKGITDLSGSPEYIGGVFTCSNNSTLTSLKGCPKRVDGDFSAFSTGISHIDDFPEHVGGGVNISGCKNLVDFTGLPDTINGYLDIGFCDVKSLDGLPSDIKGNLIIRNLKCNGEPVTAKTITDIYPDFPKEKIIL